MVCEQQHQATMLDKDKETGDDKVGNESEKDQLTEKKGKEKDAEGDYVIDDEGGEHHVLDGGYGWVVVFGSYLAHLVIGGFMRAGGVIYLELRDKYHQSAADTAWVISLAVTVRMLFGPLASALCNRFSCRVVVMLGGVLCSLGAFISGFAVNIWFLYFSYAAIGGMGRAFIYTPAVVIVGLYFERRRGTAVGIANAGIGSGTFLIPPLVELMFANFSFTSAFILLAGFALQATVYGALLRPLDVHRRIVRNKRRETRLEDDGIRINVEPDFNKVQQDSDKLSLDSNNLVNGRQYTTLRGAYLSLPGPVLSSHPNIHLSVPNTDIRQRTSSMRGSKQSLDVIHGLDTGALLIRNSNDDLHPSLKGSIGSLVGFHRHHHHRHRNTSLNMSTGDQERDTGSPFINNEVNDNEDLESQTSSDRWLDVSLLSDVRFLTFCIGIGLYTLSFQASYVFIPPLAIQKDMTHLEAAYIVSIAGGLETTGSIVSGIFLDLPMIKPHRLHIYNFTMFVLGVLTFLMPVVFSFGLLSVVCGLYGFLLGSCLAQKATLIVDILGVEKLVSSFGILVCFQGFGVLVGPPLSGILRDSTGQYDEGFYLGGAAMVASGLVQCFGSFWHWIRTK